MRVVLRVLEFIVIVWLVRLILRQLFGGSQGGIFSQFRTGARQGREQGSEPRVIRGEMRKDPQCGTYVSTELSLKSHYDGEELHFCSRQCQEEFLQSHSRKPA